MHICAWARAVRDNRGMTAPDPASRNEIPDLNPAPDQQAVLDPQDAPDQNDPPGGHVTGTDHAALAARLVLPIIGIALAGTILGVATPITIAWMILVPAAIVLLVWKRPWRQRLDLRGLGIAALVGLLEVGYAILVFSAMNHLLVGTVAVFLMTIIIPVGVVHGRGKLRFLSLALALAGLVAFVSQAPPSTVNGNVQQASMMASIFAGLSLLLLTAVQAAVPRLGYDRGTIRGVGLTIAAAGFGVWDAVSGAIPALTGSFIAVIVAVSLLMFIIPAVLHRVGDQGAYTRTAARYNAFYPAVAMVVGGIVLGQVPSLLDLLGLALFTGALWTMSSVTIVPRRLFGKRGSGAVAAD